MGLHEIFAACARMANGSAAGDSASGGSSAVGALASVARRRGSLPMSATAKMLITRDGGRSGTVGGGCLEAEITERAIDVAASRTPAVSEHTLNSELAGDYGLTCGGTALMFIEPVFPDPTLATVYDACVNMLERGERGVLATGLDWSAGIQKVVAIPSGQRGTGTDPLLAAIAAVGGSDAEQSYDAGVFAERIAGAPRLVVFGGGHVGACVAQAAAFAGWRVTVVDDRPEFANTERLPFAESVVVAPFHALPETLGLDAYAYAVVATRGHQHDADIVEQLARLDVRYLGMLGSRRKVALTWSLLERAGIAAERLARVHAPVGLSIGADTPQEIAISIVAEMVAVRRAGSKRRGGSDALAQP